MNDFVKFILNEACMFELHQKEMNKEFKRRAEEARKAYWDACKYPRKKKKEIRKKAQVDYSFYLQMSEPLWAY
jgi:hypothetical protein